VCSSPPSLLLPHITTIADMDIQKQIDSSEFLYETAWCGDSHYKTKTVVVFVHLIHFTTLWKNENLEKKKGNNILFILVGSYYIEHTFMMVYYLYRHSKRYTASQ
jgi:hypothetical protein